MLKNNKKSYIKYYIFSILFLFIFSLFSTSFVFSQNSSTDYRLILKQNSTSKNPTTGEDVTVVNESTVINPEDLSAPKRAFSWIISILYVGIIFFIIFRLAQAAYQKALIDSITSQNKARETIKVVAFTILLTIFTYPILLFISPDLVSLGIDFRNLKTTPVSKIIECQKGEISFLYTNNAGDGNYCIPDIEKDIASNTIKIYTYEKNKAAEKILSKVRLNETANLPEIRIKLIRTDKFYHECVKEGCSDPDAFSNTFNQLLDTSQGKSVKVTQTCLGTLGKQNTPLDKNILNFILSLSEYKGFKDKITINALANYCHSPNSKHYVGEAVDLGCSLSNEDIALVHAIALKYNMTRNSESCSDVQRHWHFSLDKNEVDKLLKEKNKNMKTENKKTN